MRRRIERYAADDYQSIVRKYSSSMESCCEQFMICVEGQEVPDEVADRYFSMMERFSLGFAFHPYCGAFPTVNFAFGRPNPLVEVTAADGTVVDGARQLNPGAMFFLRGSLYGVRMDEGARSAFLEKFVDDLASVGGIPSNGVFMDLHSSFLEVPRYRRSAVVVDRRHSSDVDALRIKVDNSTGQLIRRIVEFTSAGLHQEA